MSSATPITPTTEQQGCFFNLREEILGIKKPYGPQGTEGNAMDKVSPRLLLGSEKGLLDILSNPSIFKNIRMVVTVCLQDHMPEVNAWCRSQFCNPPEETIEHLLSQRDVVWMHPGKHVGDDPSNWPTLVAAGTFPDLAIEIAQAEAQALPPDQWFKPMFNQMDKVLGDGGAIFVHCQMGVSRSAAFLAAYLIYKCDVTARETLGFLQYCRPCVLTSFLEPLEWYQRDLDRIAGPRMRLAQPDRPLLPSALLPPNLINTISQLKTHLSEKIIPWRELKKLMLEIVESIGKGDLAFRDAPTLLAQELSFLGRLSSFYLKWADLDLTHDLKGLPAEGSPKISALEALRQEANYEIEVWLWKEASHLLRRVQTMSEKQVDQLISLVHYCQFSDGLDNELGKIQESWADHVKALGKQNLSDAELQAAFEKMLSDKRQNYFDYLGGTIVRAALERPYDEKKRWKAKHSSEAVCRGLHVGEELALRDLLMSTDYREDISMVITVSDLSELDWVKRWCRRESSKPIEETIRDLLAKRNVRWICLNVQNKESEWLKLVAACTFPDLDPKAAQAELMTLNCDQWFEPVFKQIDEVVLSGKTVLVHSCDGESRAPALLAAYFIKRCDVTARGALALLQFHHPSVSTKFLGPLEEYLRGLHRIKSLSE